MYYSLIVKHNTGWGVEFGDFDRECVEFEREECIYSGIPKRRTKIIATNGEQSEIDAKVSHYNAGV